jgi:mannose-1-phosphate guanylyltransferase
LVGPERCFVCAGLRHREGVLGALPSLSPANFLGEPVGRDTLNAVGFSAAVIAKQDPEATIAIFTSDHLIEPVDRFQQIVAQGYALVERTHSALVTFGIAPSFASTGYGYLQLGASIDGAALVVDEFKEKPDAAAAKTYYEAGPGRYLWNSGMFVWRAATLLDAIRRYAPDNYDGLARIADSWGTARQEATLTQVYPTLPKISVDYAVMEPASRDPSLLVAALPMPLQWLDVGSWVTFAGTCPKDKHSNSLGAARAVLEGTSNSLVVSSDPEHLIATVGCEDLIIIHTPDATLVCRADQAEAIKDLHRQVGERFGKEFL